MINPEDFEPQIAIGVVFDLSLQHDKAGNRYIDVVKQHLIDLALKFGLNGCIYVSHPTQEMPKRQGESVYQISTYEDFPLDDAIKRAVTVIGNTNPDFKKRILFVTDRYKQGYKLQKGLNLNNLNGYNCEFCLVGIGDKYESLEDLVGPNCRCYHLDQPAEIATILKENYDVQAASSSVEFEEI